MSHLVAAPDKFRGTATAAEVAAAATRGAERAGWSVDAVPMSDGGEGLLDAAVRALGGEIRGNLVSGPLGDAVRAQWLLTSRGERTAVIEAAGAAGRALVPKPAGDDPLDATTTGVGELVLAAVDSGARRVVVGCGGSATTDGGWGAVEAIGSSDRLWGAELLAACDVTTHFGEAAALFGPQKGATRHQVEVLSARLDELVQVYRSRFGVDVETLEGSGAAGGLAGGLAALGARLVPGFELVAELVGLQRRLERADLAFTGEGRLDPPSFSGKVVGGVLQLAGPRVPVLCVVGDASDEALGDPALTGGPVEVVRLAALVGTARSEAQVVRLVEDVVATRLTAE